MLIKSFYSFHELRHTWSFPIYTPTKYSYQKGDIVSHLQLHFTLHKSPINLPGPS